ncbi:hypothetical protein QNE77_004360 [Vibrio alginolyticus]|uniref:hypothetical protein n=1 Tax=Vibrio diabolicus TaxID=50719 RepID=UPI00248025D5|nr:hypothetical protein [Vibrio diabolicus]EJA7360743.1 hypothetical protein [Vibrio alginolyticus]ELB2929679.1 hypothetical protein [Vibrio alginolyticus]
MSESKNNKWFKSVVILVIFGIAMSQLLEKTLVWNYQEDSITGAFTIYGIARALNAAISMLQGTDISVVVVSVSIGELLDPINDLIERFSWIVMMAIASLGIQKVLLSVVVSKAANLLIGAVVAGYLAALWYKPFVKYRSVSFKAICILFFIRFSLSMVFICNYALDVYYFSDQKNTAQAALVETQTVIASNAAIAIENDIDESDSWFEKAKKTFNEAKGSFTDVEDKVDGITGSVENSISSLLDLIVFYILQTVLLPIAFLFAFYKVLRLMLAMNFTTTKVSESEQRLAG